MYTWFDPFDSLLAWIAIALNILLQALFLRKPLNLTWIFAIVYSLAINVGVFLLWNIVCIGSPRPAWRGGNPTAFALETLWTVAVWNWLVNTIIWWRAPKGSTPFIKVAGYLAASQLVWIVIAFFILMIPERPFPGLEKSSQRAVF